MPSQAMLATMGYITPEQLGSSFLRAQEEAGSKQVPDPVTR